MALFFLYLNFLKEIKGMGGSSLLVIISYNQEIFIACSSSVSSNSCSVPLPAKEKCLKIFRIIDKERRKGFRSFNSEWTEWCYGGLEEKD